MSTLLSRLLRCLLIAALPWGVAGAAAGVELSGDWKLNVEKSKFGALPVPASRTISVTHREPLIKLQITEDTGKETRSTSMECTTDGKRCVNNVRGREFSSTMHWEGSTLVMETQGVYNGAEFRSVDRWSLSPDKKTLTIEREASNDFGETHQKLILEKQ